MRLKPMVYLVFYHLVKGREVCLLPPVRTRAEHLVAAYLNEAKPRLLAALGREQVGDVATSLDGQRFAFILGKLIHDAVRIEGLSSHSVLKSYKSDVPHGNSYSPHLTKNNKS